MIDYKQRLMLFFLNKFIINLIIYVAYINKLIYTKVVVLKVIENKHINIYQSN